MKARDFRVYVFSLPRSGSSMMVGVLQKLGVHMVHTSEAPGQQEKRRREHRRLLGEYVPNEHFYEITENLFAHWMKIARTPYSGCKVIVPVTGMRWGGVTYRPARVILMLRDPEEIRQSQEAFYARARAEGDGYDPEETVAYFRSVLAAEQLKLQRRKERHAEYEREMEEKHGPRPRCPGDLSETRWSAGHRRYAAEGWTEEPTPLQWHLLREGEEREAEHVPSLEYMTVEYRKIIEDPRGEIRRVAAFVEASGSVAEAVACVKPERARFKREELEVGI